MGLREIAVESVSDAVKAMRQDLEALPEEAFTKSFGDTVRTVADIVYEVSLVNDMIGALMRKEEVGPFPEGWVKAPDDCQTKAAVLECFNRSGDRLVKTVESFSEDEMLEPMESKHGPTNRFKRSYFCALHTYYHSGQLNYVQTLLGDSDWHWS